MKLCVVMCYNEKMSRYSDLNYKINKTYCDKHNIKLVRSNTQGYQDSQSNWTGISLVLKVLDNFDYVIWIDAVTRFYIDSTSISKLIKEHMVITTPVNHSDTLNDSQRKRGTSGFLPGRNIMLRTPAGRPNLIARIPTNGRNMIVRNRVGKRNRILRPGVVTKKPTLTSKPIFLFSHDISGDGSIYTGCFIVKNTADSKDFLTKWVYDTDLINEIGVNTSTHNSVLLDMYRRNINDIQNTSVVLEYGVLQKDNTDKQPKITNKPYIFRNPSLEFEYGSNTIDPINEYRVSHKNCLINDDTTNGNKNTHDFYEINHENMSNFNVNDKCTLDTDILCVYTTPNKLIRVGPNGDGGYCILDNLRYDNFISCGIGDNIQFEQEILNKYPNLTCQALDGTIDNLPCYTKNIKWINKNIAVDNSRQTTNLIEYIEGYHNILLKMDIEGSEFNWIDQLKPENLDRFSQIVIEFHWPYDKYRYKMLIKLLTTHVIVHIHGNNYENLINIGKNRLPIPEVIELTLIRKNLFAQSELSCTLQQYPIQQLDYDNCKYRETLRFTMNNPTNNNIINIGNSDTNTKVIALNNNLDGDNELTFIHNYKDTFSYKFTGMELSITRKDETGGWGQQLIAYHYSIFLNLQDYGAIPKTIHLSWKNKNIFDNQSPMILNGVINIKKFNPGYNIVISDDQDVENYLKEKLSHQDYLDIRYKHIVEKVDLWRLLKIYYEGGIYIDFDRYCNKSFDKIIKNGTRCVLPTYGDEDFSQDIMISCKFNPIFKKAITYNIKARQEGRGIYECGHIAYMHSVTEVVFGTCFGRNPGIYIMDSFRRILTKLDWFQTFREETPNHTYIFEYDPDTFKIGNGKYKDEFYKDQQIGHWSNE